MSLTKTRAKSARATTETVRFGGVDLVLLLTALALTAFGIFAVYVAGDQSRNSYAVNQALGLLVGLAGAVPLTLLDYRLILKYLRIIYGVMLAMLAAVLLLGASAGGAQRWIDLGPVQVQPSEFAKLFMVVVLAGYLARHPVGENKVFLAALGIVAAPALLVFMQPDLGTALVFGALFVVMSFIAGASLYQLGTLGVAGVAGIILALKLKLLQEYQVARLTSFLHPNEPGAYNYQLAQSKLAIGSGGITGKGFGATTLANLGFLPEDHTDFIFANLSERIGFFGGAVLLVLFFILIWRIFHVATISRDRFGVLLAVGVGTIFLFHVFVNVGMVMGIMPVTGIPLPFISYGRSSLVVSVVSLGILQSVAIRSRTETSKYPKS